MLLTLAMACALPIAASAEGAAAQRNSNDQSIQQSQRNTNANSASDRSVQQNPSNERADTAKLREANGQRSNRDVNARGGGERASQTANAQQNQAATNNARNEQLHRASPHIILVQSKIDAAQAEIRGMERLASLEREPMSDTYRQHVRSFASDVQNDVNEARNHLEQLRSSVQNIQVSDAVRNDLQSADRALQQARADLQRVDTVGRNAQQPTPQPPQGQAGQAANQPRQFTNYRDFGNAISGDLNNAKTAVGRIERALR
jgi:hypothetical protein